MFSDTTSHMWLTQLEDRHRTLVAAEEGDVRLADGAASDDGSAQFGRLEIYAKGGWGTVCSSSFGDPFASFGFVTPTAFFSEESADVACQQLGFKKGTSMQPAVWILPPSHAFNWDAATTYSELSSECYPGLGVPVWVALC